MHPIPLKRSPLLSRLLYLGSVTAGIALLLASTAVLLAVALSDPLPEDNNKTNSTSDISIEIPQIPAQDTSRQGSLSDASATSAPT